MAIFFPFHYLACSAPRPDFLPSCHLENKTMRLRSFMHYLSRVLKASKCANILQREIVGSRGEGAGGLKTNETRPGKGFQERKNISNFASAVLLSCPTKLFSQTVEKQRNEKGKISSTGKRNMKVKMRSLNPRHIPKWVVGLREAMQSSPTCSRYKCTTIYAESRSRGDSNYRFRSTVLNVRKRGRGSITQRLLVLLATPS